MSQDRVEFDEYAAEYAAWIKKAIAIYTSKYPQLSISDIRQCILMGLWAAYKLGDKLFVLPVTFAMARARGEMLDMIRRDSLRGQSKLCVELASIDDDNAPDDLCGSVNDPHEHSVYRLSENLSKKQRDVVILCDLLGHKKTEAAEILGISAEAVHCRRRFALQNLREEHNASN